MHYLSRANALIAAGLAQDLALLRERLECAGEAGETQAELIHHLHCAEIAAARWLAELAEGEAARIKARRISTESGGGS